MKNFKVSFHHGNNVYCTNIAKAENQQDVERRYNEKYDWVSVTEATEGDLREAERKGMPIVTILNRPAGELINEKKEEENNMANKGYLEQVKADVREWMEDNMDLENDIKAGQFDDLDDIREYLNDTLWTEDGVTGNASGSYTFNRAEAKEFVLADMETVGEALREFGTPADEIGNHFLNEDWEYLDVTARCYVLNTAIWEVLEEQRETIEELVAKREADEA